MRTLTDDDDWIALSDPDISPLEIDAVSAVLRGPRLSAGPVVEAFERAFATWLGRRHAVAVASGTLGIWLVLRALMQTGRIAPGDGVLSAAHSWHQTPHAVTLAGLQPQFADIDYWSGCLSADKASRKVTPRTRALIACNANGHPADWEALRALASAQGLPLIEDSTEAIGSRYRGRVAGSFGDAAVFDFSQPSALCVGEGGMVVTDDEALASELRYLRQRRIEDLRSRSIGSRVPLQAGLSELSAAVGLAQLQRIDDILARRKQVEAWYHAQMQSFEGIKPPYLGDHVDEVHWMLYVVHLGKRFTASGRTQMIEDLEACGIETAPYSEPLHQQFHYQQLGYARGQLPDTERIGDRALALPFHGHLDADAVKYIVKTLKDTSVNVGAGAAIY